MDENRDIYVKEINGTKIIIADPNKLDDGDGSHVDRYVKQEDLVMYAKLEVISTPKSGLLQSDSGTNVNTIASFQYVNFLNPTDNKTEDGINLRNSLTTRWTDLFEESRDYDTETFGITNIDIEYNASFIPTVNVSFTDIRGKTLFERGDDPNNPYNIFFQFPYPEFKLTVKGYYGRTLTLPLILETTNTSFDAQSGDYITNCVFRSFTFAMLNDLTLKQAVQAPYMYEIPYTDSNGLKKHGFKGLNILVNILHKYYQTFGIDLAGFESIPYKSGDEIEETLDALGRAKIYPITIPNLVRELKGLEKTVAQSYNVAKNVKDYENIIQFSRLLNEIDDYIIRLLENEFKATKESIIKYLIPTNVTTQQIKIAVSDFVSNLIDTGVSSPNTQLQTIMDVVRDYYSSDDFIDGAFVSDTVGNHIILTNSNEFLYDQRTKLIDSKKATKTILSGVIKEQVKTKLGFYSTMSNINLIVLANAETFLKLLYDASIDAGVETETRLNKKSDGYQQSFLTNNDSTETLFPWPDFFKEITNNTTNTSTTVKTYPGLDPRYSDWAEVKFIEELMDSVTRINSDIKIFNASQQQQKAYSFTPVSPEDVPVITDSGTNSLSSVTTGTINLRNIYNVNSKKDKFDYTLTTPNQQLETSLEFNSLILVRMMESAIYNGFPFGGKPALNNIASEFGEADANNYYTGLGSPNSFVLGTLKFFTVDNDINRNYFDEIFINNTNSKFKTVEVNNKPLLDTIRDTHVNRYYGGTLYMMANTNQLLNDTVTIANKEEYGRSGDIIPIPHNYNETIAAFIENDLTYSNTTDNGVKYIINSPNGLSDKAISQFEAFKNTKPHFIPLTNSTYSILSDKNTFKYFNKSSKFRKLYIGSLVSDGSVDRTEYLKDKCFNTIKKYDTPLDLSKQVVINRR